ncbi:MAG TPA: tRNA (adenosine(37)-N6)-dimethylallyltransferase MiaA [Gemmatimonadaceae bacterium]|nr:tRNA (adenosine(37)-N6)-dimethylallyltransferase MiaA [Gemmatimonadaceae bacterium]
MADAELRVITGPTASGKSALALKLAEQFPITILSADSRQIYRGFDIGTAKPSHEELEAVPHRGVDLVDPIERYSAAAWAAAAGGWIAESAANRRTPVVVGGTGFYIRALVAPLFAEPPLDPRSRAALGAALAGLDTAELRRWTEALDPERAHLGRAQLLRAVEVSLLTGIPISEWHRRAPGAPGRGVRYLVVDPGRALAGRIEARVLEMLSAGWEAEVAALVARVPSDAPAWNASGYRAVRDLVEGRISRERAIERTVIDTRQYAKRQRTWIRNQLRDANVTFIDPLSPDALDAASAWFTHAREASQ